MPHDSNDTITWWFAATILDWCELYTFPIWMSWDL